MTAKPAASPAGSTEPVAWRWKDVQSAYWNYGPTKPNLQAHVVGFFTVEPLYLASPVAAPTQGTTETPGTWEQRCAVLYQVIGALASACGIFETSNDVADALDVACGRGDVDRLLPWPKDVAMYRALEARNALAPDAPVQTKENHELEMAIRTRNGDADSGADRVGNDRAAGLAPVQTQTERHAHSALGDLADELTAAQPATEERERLAECLQDIFDSTTVSNKAKNADTVFMKLPAIIRLLREQEKDARRDELERENAALRDDADRWYEKAKSRALHIDTLQSEISRLKPDAARWRALGDLTYTAEPLFNARTGEEIADECRWTIWWNGPRRGLFRDAIDAAIDRAVEQRPESET